MFNNLIESSSHAQEFKRRGSFLLFTTAVYAMLFVAIGVVKAAALNARSLRHINHRCGGKTILPKRVEGNLKQHVLVELSGPHHWSREAHF